MKKYVDDIFYWEGKPIACVFVDEDGDFGIEYRLEGLQLYFGAVRLLIEWEQEMFDKYKEL